MSRISSLPDLHKARWPHIYLGVALTTLATLLLELSLTRIFSVVFYYHFAFLAISLALFGLGAGGVLSYYVAARPGGFFQKLGTLATLNCLAVTGALSFVMTRSGAPGNTTLALTYFASALPFLFSGTIVSLVVGETVERIDRVYFFDLLGAAGGCLVLVPLLALLGGPNTVLVAAVLFAVSAAIWWHVAGSTKGRMACVALALGVVFLMAYNGKARIIDLRYAKGQRLEEEKYVRWNSFSRIALAREGNSDRMHIVIDADAATGIPKFNWDRLSQQDLGNLLRQGPGFPYAIRPAAKALIIGPGGGWDVARALASGSHDITGVEINPLIATTIMRKQYPDLSNRLYFRPEVRIVVEDGRSFVRRSDEKYQVLQATLVDTWASTAAGAFALSENNLYTSNAFLDYLNHLTDDGVLAFTRWGFDPPRESLRLVSLAMDALDKLGELEAWRHVMVIREDAEKLGGWGAQDTVLISRKPFTPVDIDRARAALNGTRLQRVYLPGDPASNAFGQLLLSPDPAGFIEHYAFDVSPVGDDRPFFFYTVQPRDLWAFVTSGGGDAADYKINRALPLLFGLVAISIVATLIVLALPPLLLGSRLPVEKGVRGALWYFVAIGAGYILIQVALIQKFILFLGHPTYALTVIIFSMLISSGLGSYYSRRILHGLPARLRWVLCGVAALVAVLAFIATPLTGFGVGWPLPLKIAVTIALIAPAGFLMGMPFPTGLSWLEERYPQAVRWAWSLNSASSVLGSACAIFLAIYFGLRATLLIGGAMYLWAWVLSQRYGETPE